MNQYNYKYVRETAQIAGIDLPALARDFYSLCTTDPMLKKNVYRMCWLRETGQQIKRLPMTHGTGVQTVDTGVKTFQNDAPRIPQLRK